MAAHPSAVSQSRRTDLALLGATVGWALTFPLTKSSLGAISVGLFLVVRFALGAGTAVLVSRRSPWDRASLVRGALLGVLLWGGIALNTLGLSHTGAARAGFITSLYVPFVPVLGALFFRRRVSWSGYLGAGIAAAGLVVLGMPSLRAGATTLFGDLLVAGSAVSYALHILLTERFSKRIHHGSAVVAQLAVVAVLSVPMLLLEDVRFVPSAALIGTLLFMGVFVSAFLTYLQMWAQARASALRVALIFALEPIVAAVFCRFLLGERLTASTIQGGALIVVGVFVAEILPSLLARLRGGRAPASIEPAGAPTLDDLDITPASFALTPRLELARDLVCEEVAAPPIENAA